MITKCIFGDLQRQSCVIPLGICMVGMAFAVVAGPREMPEIFREAAKSSGGVMSFVTALEDEAFRTGSRAEVEAQRWNVQGMIFQIDCFRDRDLLLADVAEWLLPSAERGRAGEGKGVNAAASYAYAEILPHATANEPLRPRVDRREEGTGLT